MRRRLAFALSLLVAALATAAFALAADAPVPATPTRWLTDSAAMLSPGAASGIDRKLEAYEKQSGHQIVVWIGTTIDGAPLDDFAVRTFKAFRPGRKGHDGLLMVVLARDRKVAIEVGYGLEDRVPDAVAKRIIEDVMAPRLRAGDANGAIDSGVDAILSAIEGRDAGSGKAEQQPARDTQPGAPRAPPSMVQLVFFGLLALGFLVLLVTHPSLAMYLMFTILSGGRGGGGGFGGGGFGGGGGRSGGGGARGGW